MTGQQTDVPDYNNLQFVGMFRGPLRIPRLLRNPGRTCSSAISAPPTTTPRTQSQRMPTALERNGDFSQTVDGLGRPITVIDPSTGLPFPGNTIPRDRISPQAAALLGYYPRPTVDSPERFNYQAPIVSAMRQDSVQSRVTQNRQSAESDLRDRRTISGARSTRRRCSASTMRRRRRTSTSQVNWNRRVSQFLQLRTRYQFTQQSIDASRRTSRIGPTCRARPASPATTRSRSTGARRRCRSRASPDSRTDCRESPT